MTDRGGHASELRDDNHQFVPRLREVHLLCDEHDDVAMASRYAAHREREERYAVSYIEFNLEGSIVTVPETEGDSFNVVVIYGGQHYANRSWMQKQTPDEIMDRVICVFAEYTVAYTTVVKQLGPFLASNKLKATGMAGWSIMGFSAGGYPTLDAYTPTHQFIGLMDPSFRKDHLTRTYSQNVAMLWGSSGQVATFGEERFKKLEAAILNGGGFSERLKLEHSKFPGVFMARFKSRLF